MLNKIGNVVLIALATLGVLFIVLLLWPDDEKAEPAVSSTETVEEAKDEETSDTEDAGKESSEEAESVEEEAAKETDEKTEDAADTDSEETAKDEDSNTVTVNIPDSQISDDKIKFKSVTLDNKKVDQSIFSDYDLTIVHVWGTFCTPCIEEMGDYAKLYKKLPDNINLIAFVCDVYDGIDVNVSSAKDILSDNSAKYMNIKTSDSVYDITAEMQYVPSSFFVDSKGHLVGQMMDGASFSDTKRQLDSYIE